MAKKIILFLSLLSEDESKRTTKDYACAAGVLGMGEAHKITGTQTNEAPVKAMLLAHPDVRSIICIVTPQAKKSTLDFFKTHILEFAREKQIKLPDDIFKIIDFQNDEVFTEGPLQRVLNEIQPGGMGKNSMGDEILLETTGGWRNTMMYLLLLSRVLTYNHNQTIGATYADFNNQQITDVSDLLRMFDLVGGMQEMSSFGNVRTLRKYFGTEPQDERIGELLNALEALNEAITLCRTRQINDCMAQFNLALKAVGECSDPLLRVLIPAFRYTFRERELTTVGLIRWCLSADMLQQAITVYTERIPAEIFGKRDILRIDDGTPLQPSSEYVDADVSQFVKGFLRSSHCTQYLNKFGLSDYYRAQKDKNGDAHYAEQIETIVDMGKILPYSGYKLNPAYSTPQMQTIARDYLYIKQLRNMTNHANDEGTSDIDLLMEYLVKCGYHPLEEVTAAYIRQVIENALKHLEPPPREANTKKKKGKK